MRSLRRREREAALARLRADPRANLFLLDVVRHLGSTPSPGEGTAEALGAWRGGELVGVASLRPTVVLDARLEPDALEALLDPLSGLHAGLVRCPVDLAGPLWERLAARGRRAMVDRHELGFVLGRHGGHLRDAPPGVSIRRALPDDLEPLVEAARASLREEGRPDPFVGDPRGFRRWVRARLPRARVAEREGQICFVGYADVRLVEGWLLQGVYTWPTHRGLGIAAAGVSALCQDAFAAGADHVQLSVVEGNASALGLYARLGFERFATLRTLLFV